MAVIISSDLVLTDTESGGGVINDNNPLIGYKNRGTKTNVSTTTALSGSPASNLANPSTNLRWEAQSLSPADDEYITLNLQTAEEVDYIAVARHNWGSEEIPVSVEVEDDTVSPPTWTEVISETLLANDEPVLFRFTAQGITKIRIRLQPGTEAPYAAVVYCGKLLVMQRRLFVGHMPINYAREVDVTNPRSQSGDYLGSIVLTERKRNSATFENLTSDWVRTNLDPFLDVAREQPWFFVWRPDDYPREIGYVTLTNNPKPEHQHPDMMRVMFDMVGVA